MSQRDYCATWKTNVPWILHGPFPQTPKQLPVLFLTVHTVHWTQGRQGASGEDGRKCRRNCRHVYSLQAGAAAIALDTLYSHLSWLIQPKHSREGFSAAATAAKSLQSCPTLCDPIDSSPLRLSRPWDSPRKNTGVGCHHLLRRASQVVFI